MDYINFTSDTNFIQYSSDHLTKFTTFFEENLLLFHLKIDSFIKEDNKL